MCFAADKKLRSLRSLRQSFCVANISPRWDCALLVAYIHGECLLQMQHAMTTHTTPAHGGFLISKYTVVWGPRRYHFYVTSGSYVSQYLGHAAKAPHFYTACTAVCM